MKPVSRTKGFTLIEVLIALVVLSVGLMGLAKVYLITAPAIVQNKEVTTASTAALSFWALEQIQTSQPASFTATSAADVPAYLQGWMQQYGALLPQFKATLTTGSNVLGQACSSTTCAMTLSLSWSDHGVSRNQVYVYQKGF